MADILGEKKICNLCGKCCRLISALKSYEELSADAKNGDEVAMNFLKLFLPYSSIDEVREIDEKAVEEKIAFNKLCYGEETQTYFYYCRYIDEANLCQVYNSRPKVCRQYPKNEFIITPKDCAYEGYAFMAREKVKAKVRKAKEQLLEIAVMRETQEDKGAIEKMNKSEKNLHQYIEQYKIFGSENW